MEYGGGMGDGEVFRFKKSLGQNFISDVNLLSAIAADAGISGEDTVVEIGAGAGGLTAALAKKAEAVYAFEVDRSLKSVLDDALADADNVKIIFADVMKLDDGEIKNIAGGSFKVVANLPYYIAVPLIFRFLESELDVESLTVMVQKEVAERLIARPGTKRYAAVTVAADFYADVKILRTVKRGMFYPAPKVDSALVGFKTARGKYPAVEGKRFLRFVSAAFSMRRKTLANNLNAAFGIAKIRVGEYLATLGFPAEIRGERLSTSDFIKLYKTFYTEP
ncbi:MAG: 16S rRNA (adenine(1518)-N(6)/adenine(1519)-N(6))-dimethyltransferase RsmA [Clostridiales bacterium]|jgi:16S rRNA (adenine1518-N6/adenine1519-N6)-dimethyltransferase|nr:16S rRNA (adenine(1518)-N(6)/adenine(1519)-N(6))-dimethyltransferase RsmA [Clostridiales bacterium]